MLASRRKLYQMESFVFVLLSSRHATTRCFLVTLVQVAMNFGHAVTPGGIVLHLRNTIHAMYDHATTHTLSTVFRLPMIERYVNPAIAQ
jgi:hypothetical protein